MKKSIIALICVFFIISCSNDDSSELIDGNKVNKENYIKDNFPKVLSLEKSEIDIFKVNMIFNEYGILSSWDGELLEKVYPDEEEFSDVLFKIYNKLDINTSKIVIIDKDNNERVLTREKNRISLFNEEKLEPSDPYVRTIYNAYNVTDHQCYGRERSICTVLVPGS